MPPLRACGGEKDMKRLAMLMLLALAALALCGCRYAVVETGETLIEAATPTPEATPRTTESTEDHT